MQARAEVKERRRQHYKYVDRDGLIKVDYTCFEVSAEPGTWVTAESRKGRVVRVFDQNKVRLPFRKIGEDKWQM